MGVEVRKVRDVVSRYVALLRESVAAVRTVEKWGLDAELELLSAEKIDLALSKLVARGVEEI